MNPTLIVNNIETYIHHYHILQGVSFIVPENQVTMLLGRNGAGKTTTLRSIMKMSPARSGDIVLFGESIDQSSTRDIANVGVSYIPENLGIFGSLTVAENMRVAAKHGPINDARLNWIFGIFPEIKKFWYWPADRLSGGQKQMLAISRALIEPTRLLIMDEPSKGLAPFIIELLVEIIHELKQLDTTMLIVEQNFKFSKSIGDNVVVMDNGKVVCQGTMADFSDNEGMQVDYLGLNLAEHEQHKYE
ncbi:MAG: ABC transporter ATP-binding protein [Agarilytica sp.]